MRPVARHRHFAAADFQADAAVLRRVIDLSAAQPKRVLHAFDRRQIGQAPAATDHDILRRAPLGEAAGVVLVR